MNIVSTQYSLGQGAYEIYVSGCDGSCPGCHNRELQDYTLGMDYKVWFGKIENALISFSNLIKSIWVLGGEPLLQNQEDLIDLLKELRRHGRPIYLFTRFELDQVPEAVQDLVDYIKTGDYREKERTEGLIQYGIALASANQRIWSMDEIRKEKEGESA